MATLRHHSTVSVLKDGRIVIDVGDDIDATAAMSSWRCRACNPDRPQIIEAPEMIEYGSRFEVKLDRSRPRETIGACLVRLGLGAAPRTGQNQCRVPLDIASISDDSIQINAPANVAIAAPGMYMLRIHDIEGVLSDPVYVRLPA